jgi:general secretion pathway protein D
VHASVVLVGQDPSELSYPELLTVLDVYGYVAVEDGKLVRILPDGRVRAQALPTITSGDTRPGSEWVTEVIAVKNLPATQLVPLLRPMVPQAGHLVAVPDTNSLILTDRFANVRRLEGLIRTLDAAEPAKTLAPQNQLQRPPTPLAARWRPAASAARPAPSASVRALAQCILEAR